MTTSPPSAIAGSTLYIPFAAVQRSEYSEGITDSTRLNGLSIHVMCACADRSAAAVQASWGVPKKIPNVPSGFTTREKQATGVFTMAAAGLIISRTGVFLVPIT